ncbi:MAG: glycerol-3-phosphate 1-O-acyltransferase PlsY [Clostridia bacterium]|nr:glycerol-3-phosphate 1-O-acyltransferase PlsY [Clostridia bacterium]
MVINGFMALASDVTAPVVPKISWNVYSYLVDTLDIGGSAAASWLLVGFVVLCAAVAYLLGSINPAIIFSNLMFKDDIRNHGSGNAGSTNVLRTFGKKMAALIFILDLLKAVLACFIGKALLATMGGAIGGLFVIVGHTAPIFYKFKGGKGAACLAGVALAISPWSFIILFPTFIIIALVSRYVSLGSIMVSMLFPIVHRAFHVNDAHPDEGWTLLASIFIMGIVVFMHRANIKRLMNGTESKLSFGKKKKEAQSAEIEDKNDSNGQ